MVFVFVSDRIVRRGKGGVLFPGIVVGLKLYVVIFPLGELGIMNYELRHEALAGLSVANWDIRISNYIFKCDVWELYNEICPFAPPTRPRNS